MTNDFVSTENLDVTAAHLDRVLEIIRENRAHGSEPTTEKIAYMLWLAIDEQEVDRVIRHNTLMLATAIMRLV